jgi:acetyltransferase-like isoleucine patch superfamily enzyme
MPNNFFIHPMSDVQTSHIGAGSKIWQYVVILPSARIGSEVNICAHCFIENDVSIGNRVTIKSGVYLWDGIELEDDVFIGPNVTFTNDKFPRSKLYPAAFLRTRIEKGASIGAGAVLLPGISIGSGAMIGSGAVVTNSVPSNAIATGSPARIVGYVQNSNADYPSIENGISESEEHDVQMIGVGSVSLHRLKFIGDIRGDLSVGNFSSEVPFVPKRYFLVFNVPSTKTRGEHAHHQCKQFLLCIKGSCSVVVDNGESRKEIVLNKPNLGLYLPPLIWGIQYKYSEDAVLLVFASEEYDAQDYIRNYSDFIEIAKAAKPA